MRYLGRKGKIMEEVFAELHNAYTNLAEGQKIMYDLPGEYKKRPTDY